MKTIGDAKATLGDEFSFFFDLIHAQLKRLDLSENARILDVGTGMGRTAVTLALCGHPVLTGEPADDGSEYAKQPWREQARAVGVEAAITYQPFDATRMPFPTQSFDAVFMVGALHHISDPATALAESLRVLSPGGAVCVLEPNAEMIEIVRAKHPDHPAPVDPTRLVQGALAIETIHEEKFDVYVFRRR